MTTLLNTTTGLYNENGEFIPRKAKHSNSSKVVNNSKSIKTAKLSKQEVEVHIQKLSTRTERLEFRMNNQKSYLAEKCDEFVKNFSIKSFDLRSNPDSETILASMRAHFSKYAKTFKKYLGMGLLVGGIITTGLFTVATNSEACVEEYKYEVKSGDTLYSLAKLHGVDVDAIKSVNELSSNSLRAHQHLIMPAHNQITGKVVHPHVEQEVEPQEDNDSVVINKNVKAYVNVNKGGSLRVRQHPNTASAAIGSVTRGQELTVHYTNNGWAEITFNGKTGYVSSAFLNFNNKPSVNTADTIVKKDTTVITVTTTSTTVKEKLVARNMYVTASKLNVRSNSNTHSSVLGSVARNSKVYVISETSNGWAKVSYNGKTGYMSLEHLTSKPSIKETSSKTTTVTNQYKVRGIVVGDEPQFIHFKINGKIQPVEVTNQAMFNELKSLQGQNLELLLKQRPGKNPLLVSYQ